MNPYKAIILGGAVLASVGCKKIAKQDNHVPVKVDDSREKLKIQLECHAGLDTLLGLEIAAGKEAKYGGCETAKDNMQKVEKLAPPITAACSKIKDADTVTIIAERRKRIDEVGKISESIIGQKCN